MRDLRSSNSQLEAAVKEISLTLLQLRDNGNVPQHPSVEGVNAVRKLLNLLERKHTMEHKHGLAQNVPGTDILQVNKVRRGWRLGICVSFAEGYIGLA